MNDEQDPVRWFEPGSDAPLEMKQWLRSAREDLPSSKSLAALGIALPPAPVVPPPAAETGALASKLAGLKGLAGLSFGKMIAITVVAGGSVAYFASSDGPELRERVQSGVVTTLTDVALNSALPSSVPLEAVAPIEPLSSAESGAVPAAPPLVISAGSERRVAVPKTENAGARELRLLQQARRGLSDDPRMSLTLTEKHAREFPQSKYAQEREVIRIRALQALGREREAEQRSTRFGEEFPGSAHRNELDGISPAKP